MHPTFLYFAYGSNLLTARLRERTPSARPVGIGVLRQHALCWHKASSDDSGKCDVVPVEAPASQVLGVVYAISMSEKPALDTAEALGTGYAEKQITVEVGRQELVAWVYYALQIDPRAVPYDWYKALVVRGALEHGIASHYVETLEAVPAKADPDVERAQRHFRLAGIG